MGRPTITNALRSKSIVVHVTPLSARSVSLRVGDDIRGRFNSTVHAAVLSILTHCGIHNMRLGISSGNTLSYVLHTQLRTLLTHTDNVPTLP